MGQLRQLRQARHANYYEAILQLRNPDDELIGFVNRAIKAEPDVTLAKRKKVTNGFDYYLSSNRFTIELGRHIFSSFGGELKITKKLFSQHRLTSKVLYRMTVLFRMSPFKVGDFILLDGLAYRITSFSKKTYVALNLENSKPVEFDYKELLRSAEKHEPVSAVVSKVRPYLEVIHPSTFQSVAVLPLKKDSKLVPGERTKVLLHEEKIWNVI